MKVILMFFYRCYFVFLFVTLIYQLFFIILTKVEEINAIFGQQQIETINNTLTLINMIYPSVKQEKVEYYKRNNITKCVNWCIKYKVPYNKVLTTTGNIFQ